MYHSLNRTFRSSFLCAQCKAVSRENYSWNLMVKCMEVLFSKIVSSWIFIEDSSTKPDYLFPSLNRLCHTEKNLLLHFDRILTPAASSWRGYCSTLFNSNVSLFYIEIHRKGRHWKPSGSRKVAKKLLINYFFLKSQLILSQVLKWCQGIIAIYLITVFLMSLFCQTGI